MFSRSKIKLDAKLYERAAARARAVGAASVDAYVARLVEADLKAGDEEALKNKVMEKMKGLGYLQ